MNSLDVSADIPATTARVRRGFDSGRTRNLTWRSTQLSRLKALLVERERQLLDALFADLGKSPFEGWVSEVNLVIAEVEHTLDHLERWVQPERVPTPLVLKPGQSKVHREPLGVVLIIGPWNYPLQLVLAPLVGALAAGNAAIIKPSEVSENTSRVLADLLPTYLDADCVAVVQGGVPETTALLAQRFDHIFYTGSGNVARIIMRAAAEHLTPVTLELGGKSPCIVDREANLKVTARRVVWGKFFNAGQTCVAPDYVLAHKDIVDPLIQHMRDTLTEFYGSDPKQSRDYGRIINDRHFQRLRAFLADGEVVAGGEVDPEERYIAPTLLRSVSPEAPVMSDEIFGPILPIITVNDLESAIAFVNRRPKPLALYIFSEDRAAEHAVLSRTTSGGACVNDTVAHLSVPDLPFGGVGASGMGAYHGRASFETFSHRKSVLHKSTRLDASLRYPPYDESKVKWARRLM
jgi:aldehyde dehydrogenase (NAD+)